MTNRRRSLAGASLRVMGVGLTTLALLAASAGCASSAYAQAAVARFAVEHSCPASQTSAQSLGGGTGARTFRVTGCGVAETYICLGAGSSANCVRN